eukprot:TRINITY_DN15302_c0_g1_i1.p1 TRINITY_DN15302_c0_g1~~TRINITY_DN15302_c0_g1_i1.p1  ORF type:complete len:794 (-),score=101.83 TRINITY_DN15302_c0_g1_i1:107-2413(-)
MAEKQMEESANSTTSAADVHELASLFARCASATVNLTDGWLLPRGRVVLQRSIGDVDDDCNRVVQHTLRVGEEEFSAPSEIPGSVSAVFHSPTGQHSVRVVKSPRFCLELWRCGALIVRVDCSRSHDAFQLGGAFGGFSWSPDEGEVVYVAQAKAPKAVNLFSPAPQLDATVDVNETTPTLPGRAHWHREDWGEKNDGTDNLQLFVVNFQAATVKRLEGVPDDITPGQPVFWGTQHIVYTGRRGGGVFRRLGIEFCSQRRSSLYLTAITPPTGTPSQNHACLTRGLRIARCPRPARAAAGENSSSLPPLAFLGSLDGFDTHGDCMELFVLHGLDEAPRCIVAAPDVPTRSGFAGIFTDVALPRDCWKADVLYFNAPSGARGCVWSVAVTTASEAQNPCEPSPVAVPSDACNGASMRLLAANEEGLLLSWSSPDLPAVTLVRRPTGDGDVPLPRFGPCAVAAGSQARSHEVEKLGWSLRSVAPPDGCAPFDAVLVHPIPMPDRPGLILFLHGGPHSVSTTEFHHSIAFLARATSCAVLLVNYRGSIGFGRRALRSLPGSVGSQDVEDCLHALRTELRAGVYDETRLGVVGGSHGGFLSTHLIGQQPTLFKAASVRNPVTNLASMVTATDIPDWTFIEALGLGTYKFDDPGSQGLADPAQLTTMWSKSPCAHVGKVVAPLMVALGLRDRRVPPSQGLEFYNSLRARGAPTRLVCYEKEGHALDGPAADADYWINTAVWFNEHMPPPARTSEKSEVEGGLPTKRRKTGTPS